jgi:hypothetical protein
MLDGSENDGNDGRGEDERADCRGSDTCHRRRRRRQDVAGSVGKGRSIFVL